MQGLWGEDYGYGIQLCVFIIVFYVFIVDSKVRGIATTHLPKYLHKPDAQFDFQSPVGMLNKSP